LEVVRKKVESPLRPEKINVLTILVGGKSKEIMLGDVPHEKNWFRAMKDSVRLIHVLGPVLRRVWLGGKVLALGLPAAVPALSPPHDPPAPCRPGVNHAEVL
jgi:hypothetical protein